MKNYDLIIIGGGPAGYNAAVYAARNNVKTLLIEKDEIGGTCLNYGCIPSKCFIETADILNGIQKAKRIGADIKEYSADWSKALSNSKLAVKKLYTGIKNLFSEYSVDTFKGEAFFEKEGEVKVKTPQGDDIFYYKNLLLAMGSEPVQLKGFEFDGAAVLSSRDILNLNSLPSSIAVIGAGAIGIELAYILNAFSVKVYLIEAAPTILPRSDKDASALIEKALRKSGIEIFTGARSEMISKSDKNVKLNVDGKEIEAEKVLVAAGRKPAVQNISAPLQKDGDYIKVNGNFRTSLENVYAAGDIINTPQLAHAASKEAECAVDSILKKSFYYNAGDIPFCLYSYPELAEIGLSEEYMKKRSIEYKKQTAPYGVSGKAHAALASEGFVKIMYDRNKKILGAVICGKSASEIISNISVIKSAGLTLDALKNASFPHPTISEIINQAVNAAF